MLVKITVIMTVFVRKTKSDLSNVFVRSNLLEKDVRLDTNQDQQLLQ